MTVDDNRYIHDITIEVVYVNTKHNVHVVYIRNTQGVDANNPFDILDKEIDEALNSLYYVNVLNHDCILINNDAELSKWDQMLKTHTLYRADFWFDWCDVAAPFPHVQMTNRIYATILVPPNSSLVPSFSLIGVQKSVGQSEFNDICKAYKNNPILKLQEHPLLHGVTCYYDASLPGLTFFFNDVDTQTEVLITYNQNTKEAISSHSNVNMQEATLISDMHYRVQNDYNVSHLFLNRQNALFEEGKQALIAQLKSSEHPSDNSFIVYLTNMQEA